MQISSVKKDAAVVVSLAGRMDAMTTVEFDRWFAEQLSGGTTAFVLNMQALDYISSAGLRSLLAAAKQLKAKNGTLALCCLSGTVEEVFRMSGFLTILSSYPTVDEACASLT